MKLRTTIVFFLLFVGYTEMISQPCPPGGNLTFTTQSQIDIFPHLFPDCTEIEVSVKIEGSDIYNLNGLSKITSIGGDFRIQFTENLVDLTGLNNLSYIGHTLEILDNDSLISISALNNLTEVGDFVKIIDNPLLMSLTGLENITTEWLDISNNDNLTDLTGLNSMDMMGWLIIGGNDGLLSLVGLEQLSDVHYITIEYNQSLQSLVGLNSLKEVRSLHILSNSSIFNLGGMDSLPLIESLIIEENAVLQTLSGVDSVQVINDLIICYNPQLSICDVQSICNYLANPGWTTIITSNNVGCNSVQEVENACTVGISEQQSASHLSAYPNPFTTSTTIEYELTEPSHVQLTIYNAIGEKVYTTEDRIIPQGNHTVTPSSLLSTA